MHGTGAPLCSCYAGNSGNTVLIHQITDLHIPDTNDDERFVHVRENVLRQLALIEADGTDLLVMTGDLTMTDGSRAGCEWIRSVLPPVPTVVIPGNHDDPALLYEVFGAGRCMNPCFCFMLKREGRGLVFVNTTGDRLPEDQLRFLSRLPQRASILFMHHPPDLISDGFMALNQPLWNYVDVASAIRSSPITHVFCGHYHNAIDKDCDGFSLHLTPSPAFQIDLHSRDFLMQDFRPSVRRIILEGEYVDTQLVYV